jgi:hypothetical protein
MGEGHILLANQVIQYRPPRLTCGSVGVRHRARQPPADPAHGHRVVIAAIDKAAAVR